LRNRDEGLVIRLVHVLKPDAGALCAGRIAERKFQVEQAIIDLDAGDEIDRIKVGHPHDIVRPWMDVEACILKKREVEFG